MTRDTYARRTLGDDLYSKVSNAKVLVVGAGGIGCELLKDLVLLGFKSIDIVDLDTIDLSNLNRQFLFGPEHIKKSKALVAKETASQFNPNAEIRAHHENIMAEKFSVFWFKQFDVVYNALDNMEARRYVNRMCLAADVPLIESGTTGFLGQVQVIVKDKTECYDCTGKLIPKQFAVCTIRSTPSQPVHNITWAKQYLFSQLFEPQAEGGEFNEDDGSADSAEEKQNMQREFNELKELRASIMEEGAFEKLVNKIFDADIERLLSMEEMWKARKRPTPLKFADLKQEVESIDGSSKRSEDQKVWNVQENLAVLKHSLARLQKRANDPIEFDKDDEDTLDFVVSAANIRSQIFSIEQKSKFECKQIAGNIIPAVATINAVVSGVCVLQSLKVLEDRLEDARIVYMSRQRDRVFAIDSLPEPNPHCVVSGIDRCTFRADPSKHTLGDLVESLKSHKYSEEISIITDRLLYDPDFEDNADRTFDDLGIKNGGFITAVDEDDETNHVNLELILIGESTESVELLSVPSFKTKPVKTPEPEDDDDEEVVEDSGHKRKADSLTEPSSVKRLKAENGTAVPNGNDADDDVILIDDEDDIIEID